MISNIQVKMARAALGWGVRELGKKAGVAANTISRFENGADAMGATLASIEAVLMKAGIEFLPDNGVRYRAKRSENA